MAGRTEVLEVDGKFWTVSYEPETGGTITKASVFGPSADVEPLVTVKANSTFKIGTNSMIGVIMGYNSGYRTGEAKGASKRASEIRKALGLPDKGAEA